MTANQTDWIQKDLCTDCFVEVFDYEPEMGDEFSTFCNTEACAKCGTDSQIVFKMEA